MPDAVLTLNAGSSSVKFALFRFESGTAEPMLRGQIEKIGEAPHFVAADSDGHVIGDRHWPDPAETHENLLALLLDWVNQHLGAAQLAAVGHRIVHGGPDHVRPVRVTDRVLRSLEDLVPLAPLHQPHNLAPIRAISKSHPNLPQVACFDTAFHHTMPKTATRFALPEEYAAQGIRRYGFHGISYEYIASRLHEIAPVLAAGRVIVAHLGNGASLCAMREGKSVDTTMSLTALDGLVMGTRSGSIDPGVLLYLAQTKGMSADAIADLLYHRSGLLGVSGIASDMRTLLASREARATDAIELFVFRMAREIGALAASLGGLDGIVFTAGIGEHAPAIRAAVCQRIAWLGVTFDAAANARGDAVISAEDSGIDVRVIPTDEEVMIARHTRGVVG